MNEKPQFKFAHPESHGLVREFAVVLFLLKVIKREQMALIRDTADDCFLDGTWPEWARK
jgi:hypothetical protein